MSGEGYHVLLECRRRSGVLRAKGFSFDQIVDIFALFHEVSPLRLYRYAHGRTGAEVVAAYNDLDPAGTAALRESRLYVFEAWPDAERRPSARALTIFAQVYQTTARRLVTDQVYGSYSARDRDLIDRTDHRHLDSQCSLHVSRSRGGRVTMDREAAGGPAPAGGDVAGVPGAVVPGPADCGALLRALAVEEADVRRRDVLFELALALGGAPALLLLRHLSVPEKDRLAAVVRASSRVDTPAVEVIEKLTARCRRLDDEYGPDTVLPIVEGQRALVADLLRRETMLPALRDRLTSAYAQLGQFAGWLHYDLMDYAGARERYQEALTAAHQIADPTMVAYLHTCLSYVAVYQGDVGRALDHVFAAQGWARRSPSNLIRSVHAMELARALARHGNLRESERAVAQSASLAEQPKSEGDPAYLYWWTVGQVRSSAADCMLHWGRLDEAIDSVERTLVASTTFNLARGLTLLHFAEALTRKREIPPAVDKIRGAARVTVVHSSGRLADSVRQARARLQPWAGNKYVRSLDEELRSLGIAPRVSM